MKVRFAVAVATAAVGFLMSAVPSSATVHEIVGQWCAGQGELAPPGISDPTKANFAQPLFASGVATFVPNFDGQGNNLIRFNFNHPAIKVVSAGFNFQLAPGLFITAWTTDDDFAAFQHCPGFVGGSLP
jgi:hypothetical protein